MNREIKFRTFQEGKMYFHELCDYMGSSGILNPYIGCEKAIWMQFTGLKDKNGVDVYEGDIAFHQGKNRVFIYGDGCFGFIGRNVPVVYINDFLVSQMEIIGNIHENPELL